MSEINENAVQEVNQEVDLAPEANENAAVLSFDELDQLTDGREGAELLSEGKSKKESAPKENKSDSKEAGDAKEVDVAEEAIEEEIKKILAKQGEGDVELYANTSFKHKVDGEEVDVELQELLNNYSGKMSYDKKFQEFSSERKDFETYKETYDKDIEQINGYITKFAEKIKSNDAMGALEYFAEFSGMKPHEFKRELLNQIAPEVFRLNEMSPEQLQAEDLRTQNEYLLRQQESEQKRSQEQHSQKELEMEIANAQEAHNISDEAFQNAYQELMDGEFEGNITPAVIADYYVHSQAFSKAEEALTQVDPILAQQDNILETLQKIVMENPSFDNEDLVEIVKDVYGDIKKTASKSVSKKVEPKEQVKKEPKSKEDYLEWDDL
jgi:hypothetical protein|tara:strand:- start:804 stop:1949 length:1146 start_codon:yes stop_codon:yes gene_type:complete